MAGLSNALPDLNKFIMKHKQKHLRDILELNHGANNFNEAETTLSTSVQ